MHTDPSGMGVEAMRPKRKGKETCGKGPKRPARIRGRMENSHRIKRFTKKLKRQRRA